MKWQRTLFLPLVRCFKAGNVMNGAVGAINDTTSIVAEDEINIHSIEVSRREHLFTPNSINALPGDIVTFKFWPGSHSVIRASYGRPCEPYENVQGNEGQASTVVSCRRMMWTLSKGACVDTPRQVRDNTDELSASNVELDHQHHLSNVFLLWCAWQLYQLGDGGCHQRGCRALCCHSDSVCPGESMQYCIFYCGRVMH